MAEAQERPLHELLSHHLVNIYVGQDHTHWVLHEKLLCAKSKFFNQVFYEKYGKNSSNKSFGLPDEEDEPFRLFVAWLYSGRMAPPEHENELNELLDVYLMGEKWQIASLVKDVLDAVRKFYSLTDSFPSLRRVQYIYANTDEDSPMRQLLVSSVARMLVTTEKMPAHWEKALQKNGQMSVDLIRAVQLWHLDPENIPDARKEAQETEQEKLGVAKKNEKQNNNPEEKQGEKKSDQKKDAKDDDDKDEDDQSQELENVVNGVNSMTSGQSTQENEDE